jgi:hypothetical protein
MTRKLEWLQTTRDLHRPFTTEGIMRPDHRTNAGHFPAVLDRAPRHRHWTLGTDTESGCYRIILIRPEAGSAGHPDRPNHGPSLTWDLR